MRAPVSEIFSSIQGEGLHIGERHIFVRFGECNLKCENCDEWAKPSERMRVEEILEKIKVLQQKEGPHSFVALTGGEPLCQSEFVESLASHLIRDGFKVLLETNGTLAVEMRFIMHLISVISMDIKLSSVWKIDDCYDQHNAFLSVVAGHNCYIKIVVSPDTDTDEFKKYLKLIASYNSDIPVVLQAKTFEQSCCNQDMGKLLYFLQKEALREVHEVLVLPRLHLSLGLE